MNGQWGAPAACTYACVGTTCGGVCIPAATRCDSNTAVQTCGNDGEWGAPTTCTNACVGSSCGGVCVPGSTQCASGTTQQRCTNDGQWGAASACTYVCTSNACGGVCTPGVTRCASPSTQETCGSNGQWGASTTCPYVCSGTTCGGVCVPGTVECADGEHTRTCGPDGQWTAPVACQNVCLNDACGTNPKRVFVTSMAYSGNLGGLAGADAKCQERAQVARWPGTFRAWLSDTTASPSTRFTRGGPYLLTDNSIIANNWTGLTTQSLLHVFNLTEFIDAPPASTIGCVNSFFLTGVWTATDSNGAATADVATLSCDNWTSTASIGSFWGTTNHVGFWTAWCQGGNDAANTCATMNPLYCFEQ